MIAALGRPAHAAEPEAEPELLGWLTRAEIESAAPHWVQRQIEVAPDVEAAQGLVAALAGIEIVVVLGTWCEDSELELARFWRAFDEVGLVEPPQVRYLGVSRDKTEPRADLAGLGVEYVPTFIVRRHGVEIGRVVERAQNGIERDLLHLLLEGEGRDHPLARDTESTIAGASRNG